MEVLVTGGAGFIGSHLCDALFEMGHNVHIYENWCMASRPDITYPENIHHHKECSFVPGLDVSRFPQGLDAIFHLAARTDITWSLENPEESARNDVGCMIDIFGLAMQLRPRFFLFESSSAVYQDSDAPHTEGEVLGPLSPYGANKAFGELYTNYLFTRYSIPSVSFRLTNVFGPRQRAWGVDQPLIPQTIRILGREDVELSVISISDDGTRVRDWMYVGDLVKVHLDFMEHAEDWAKGQAINIAPPTNRFSVNGVVRKIADFLGKEPELRHNSITRPWDPQRLLLNTRLLHSMYTPSWSSFEEGVDATAAYYMSI